mmetsp:Transcript_3598/g.8582  ORF Transcript_3598/g.8582 Transcript_3598/m.8582 type:complete len:209 (+) Transcript_3598:1232-1858(+)
MTFEKFVLLTCSEKYSLKSWIVPVSPLFVKSPACTKTSPLGRCVMSRWFPCVSLIKTNRTKSFAVVEGAFVGGIIFKGGSRKTWESFILSHAKSGFSDIFRSSSLYSCCRESLSFLPTDPDWQLVSSCSAKPWFSSSMLLLMLLSFAQSREEMRSRPLASLEPDSESDSSEEKLSASSPIFPSLRAIMHPFDGTVILDLSNLRDENKM